MEWTTFEIELPSVHPTYSKIFYEIDKLNWFASSLLFVQFEVNTKFWYKRTLLTLIAMYETHVYLILKYQTNEEMIRFKWLEVHNKVFIYSGFGMTLWGRC